MRSQARRRSGEGDDDVHLKAMRIPRRTFLRGLGTTLALPILDAMVPALVRRPATPRRGSASSTSPTASSRTVDAETAGANFELTPILRPLEPFRNNINVVSGLAHLQADTFGDGTGDHPRASAAWLTGVHACDRTRPGVEVKLATSADQIIAARQIGRTRRCRRSSWRWTTPRRARATRATAST